MNDRLTEHERHLLLDVLHRGLVAIRAAAAEGNVARAHAIADALHNVPRLLDGPSKHGWSDESWTLGGLRKLFLDPLVAAHPSVAHVAEPLLAMDATETLPGV